MRGLLTLLFLFAGSSAFAHPGHWAEVAGHGHWIAGAAIALAGLAALWGASKEKKVDKGEAEAGDEELEEETA